MLIKACWIMMIMASNVNICIRHRLTQKKKNSSTASSNFASTSPTRSCSSSSTTTCSCWSRKSTSARVSSGPLSISVWTCRLASSSSKRYPYQPTSWTDVQLFLTRNGSSIFLFLFSPSSLFSWGNFFCSFI